MSAPENPPAFPCVHDRHLQEGMTLRDWFAGIAPAPDEDAVAREMDRDRARNPYNEPYHGKPRIRERHEVIAALRYKYADAMLAARKAGVQ